MPRIVAFVIAIYKDVLATTFAHFSAGFSPFLPLFFLSLSETAVATVALRRWLLCVCVTTIRKE